MTRSSELAVILETQELVVWTSRHVAKFPRSHRHVLGARTEHRLWDLLDLLVEAKVTHDKQELLRKAAVAAEQLRFLLRAAAELGLLAQSSHHHACERLDSIARQISGWRRHVEQRS